VVAELVGEGKITWDSKLSVLDPTFAMFDPWVTREITIRDMYWSLANGCKSSNAIQMRNRQRAV